MTLHRKLKEAEAAHDTEEITRLKQRLEVRHIRLGKFGVVLYSVVRLAVKFVGIQLPQVDTERIPLSSSVTLIRKKIDLHMNNKFTLTGFVAEMLLRLFSGKPKFFVYGQRIAGLLTVLLAILKAVSDPSTGVNLYDEVCIRTLCFVPETIINYCIAGCVTLIGAFQLPTPSVNDQAIPAAK